MSTLITGIIIVALLLGILGLVVNASDHMLVFPLVIAVGMLLADGVGRLTGSDLFATSAYGLSGLALYTLALLLLVAFPLAYLVRRINVLRKRLETFEKNLTTVMSINHATGRIPQPDSPKPSKV